VVMTALVPINIGGPAVAPPGFTVSGNVVDPTGAPVSGASVQLEPLSLAGSAPPPVVTDATGKFVFSGIVSTSYKVTPTLAGHVFTPASTQVVVNDQNIVVPKMSMSLFTLSPNSYTLNEAIDSLKSAVGIKTPTPAEKFRFDVSPVFNGIPAPDGVLDVKDSLNILRMVIGLNPL